MDVQGNRKTQWITERQRPTAMKSIIKRGRVVVGEELADQRKRRGMAWHRRLKYGGRESEDAQCSTRYHSQQVYALQFYALPLGDSISLL